MSSVVGTFLPPGATDRRLDDRYGLRSDLLWPSSGLVGASVLAPVRYETPRVIASGHRRDMQITFPGGAVNIAGAFVPGAIVKAFRTLDDVNNSLIADTREGPAVTVAADGSFIVSVPNGDAHYLVGYFTGPPDLAGTTVNTLVGT